MQRLSRKGVHYKRLVVEAQVTLLFSLRFNIMATDHSQLIGQLFGNLKVIEIGETNIHRKKSINSSMYSSF